MNVIGYIRVSTDDQADRFGPDVQREGIESWCRAEGHELVGMFADEGISGTKDELNRPGLAAALAAVNDGAAEGLVVYKVDRLARDLVIQEVVIRQLAKVGRSVFSTMEQINGDSPTSVMLRQMLGVIAQYELAVITGRMSAGRAMKHAKGGYAYGAPCFGMTARDKQLVADPDEQATLALIARLGGQGRSLREIALALEQAGRRPKRGERWHPSTISRILKRLTPAAA